MSACMIVATMAITLPLNWVKQEMLSICSTTFSIPSDVEIMAMEAAHKTTSYAHSNHEGLYSSLTTSLNSLPFLSC